ELRAELLAELAPVAPRSCAVPFHSTLTGERIDTAGLDAGYWYRNLRHPVEFHQVIRDLVGQGLALFVEASPHPVLTVGVQQALEEAGVDGAALGSLRRDEGGLDRFLLSVAEAHVHGVAVRWEPVFPGGRDVDLPTYPFQRERFWMSPGPSANPASLGLHPADHPLLGAAVGLADSDGVVCTGRISRQAHPWLADHAVHGAALLRGTAFVELAVRAGERGGCGTLDELALESPLLLPERGAVVLQVTVSGPDDDGRRRVAVHSRTVARSAADPNGEAAGETGADAGGTRHAAGTVSADGGLGAALTEWPPPAAEELPLADAYERLADLGYGYGPAFQGLLAAWRSGAEVYAEVALPDGLQDDVARFGVHPALLDAA